MGEVPLRRSEAKRRRVGDRRPRTEDHGRSILVRRPLATLTDESIQVTGKGVSVAGHVLSINGRSRTSFPRPHEDATEQLTASFSRMDGERLFAFILWSIPGDATFDDGGKVVLESSTYMQCAGRADALTVEMREIADDGQIRHYVLGRSAQSPGNCDVTISWRSASTTVYQNEKWTADAAAGLFISYWATGTVPPGVHRRQIDLGS